MKILKLAIDIAKWSIVKTCHDCKSELEISSKDISYHASESPPYWGGPCAACGFAIKIAVGEIPKLVQNDIIKHRYKVKPSSDK